MVNLDEARIMAEGVPEELKDVPVKAVESGLSKKQKLIFHMLAVLGAINFAVYFIVNTSIIRQNIYVVYAILLLLNLVASFLLGCTYDNWLQKNKKKHFVHQKLPTRFKNALVINLLMYLSLPLVIFQYYFSSIIFPSLLDVANFAWGVSLALSGIYDFTYVAVILGIWLTKGMVV